MGKSFKSYNKLDKETQSPLLNIFKDMMQREMDPEKANLLKEKQENRKRKQYSGSRSKSDRTIKSCDSSSSERHKRMAHYKVAHQEQRERQYTQCRTRSIPFQSDKKDSWWFWGDTQKQKSEDTCSCVSCALKQIVSSEYACIACLALVFTLTVVVAFLLVFRTIPVAPEIKPDKLRPKMDSEGLRRKIDMLNERRGWGVNDYAGYRGSFDERRDWDDTLSRQMRELPSVSGTEYSDSSLSDLNNLDGDNKLYDLSNILDTQKIYDGRSSEQLRNFYKKLIQTDKQIRNLKKGIYDFPLNTEQKGLKYDFDRSKRSLKIPNPSSFFRFKVKKRAKDNPISDDDIMKLSEFNLFYPPFTMTKPNKEKNKRSKRNNNNFTEEPTGFVIEKKKIVVQYRPDEPKRKVPKCSHAPKDSKSHETQLKHPFYKNTQRLDELLDKFLDRNLPEMMVDPFGVDLLFKGINRKNKCKHPSMQRQFVKNKNVQKMKNGEVFSTPKSDFDKDFLSHITDDNDLNKIEKLSSPTSTSYNVLLSVSTVKSLDSKKSSAKLSQTVPNRKLMQADDEDDEAVMYEDFKEVLADDVETHDENDRRNARRKKMDETNTYEIKLSNDPVKYNPPGVYNPNWKGPLPLYPDELNTMMKQSIFGKVNNPIKIEIPVIKKDRSTDYENSESDLDDVEYVEDYLDNKYERLVKMAQAYSDYGVLDGKKELRNDKTQNKALENRVKLSIDKDKFLKNGINYRLKKGIDSEGIRFEVRPTSNSREDAPPGFIKSLQKHVKVTNNPDSQSQHPSNFKPVDIELILFSKPTHLEHEISKDKYELTDDESRPFFMFGKEKSATNSYLLKSTSSENNNVHYIKRSLKSIKLDNEYPKRNNLIENSNEYNFRNMIFRKRSLKSMPFVNNNTAYDDQRVIGITSDEGISEIHRKKNEHIKHDNVSIIEYNKTKNHKNNVDIGKEFSDFFSLISNWFNTLDRISLNTNNSRNTTSSNINTIKLVPNATGFLENASIEINYPMHDSDMIENIGRRSRVLMSVNNEIINVSKIENKTKSNYEMPKSNDHTDKIKANVSNLTIVSKTTNLEATKNKLSKQDTNNAEESKSNNTDTVKLKEKRSIEEDSNLIFWNDIYDDEYGIKVDPIESKIYDKRPNKANDFMKRSGQWLREKVRRIADNYLRGSKDNTKKNKNDKYSRVGVAIINENNKVKKRSVKFSHGVADKPNNFADLTVKMKQVCKEAARAVQQVKNLKVREDSKEESVATSLMQQLVRLMTDLVDFQVQEKTCLKLPADLQNFLEWLTYPNADEYSKPGHKLSIQEEMLEDGYLGKYDKSTYHIMDLTTSSSEKDVHSETGSECLGTLHAVQSLMQQYDEMSDEDKSKMTGIKEYLENQLDYLNKQISLYEVYNIPNIYSNQLPIRYRRDLENKKKPIKHKSNRIKRRLKRRLRNYFKNVGNKHTKTTSNHLEITKVTQQKKIKENSLVSDNDETGVKNNLVTSVKFNNNDMNLSDFGANDKRTLKDEKDAAKGEVNSKPNGEDPMKRNLQDVYYKALEDSKKFTTVKNIHKNQERG